jgi:alanyl-tRNA synthetase
MVPSSSLVPEKDPSLLFVNAGMVQFKNVFLGIEKREYERATSCQKCVRAGGKHNDLENIGKTLRHHTFFEMLGNFSFGNYFKKEAIAYGWEFLTKELNLDKERLWITIFENDEEAGKIWEAAGVRPERIVRLGEKDNFWSMGDEGPCGPCSEIIYDLGEGVGCRLPSCKVGCDCDRYLEIWNLVFMEFERSRGGNMTRLPRPSIDTGMGLERITSVMQGKIGNYETDLFMPIIRRLEDLAHCAYGENERTDVAMRVIVDHARGATFIINDGILPSKDGRGYVLRRIIRRALRYGRRIGIEGEFLYDLSKTIVDVMEDVYPDVKNNHAYIVRALRGEEERFVETLAVGMKVYEEMAAEVKKTGGKTIAGDLVYKLYDTFGFPLDLTREMAEEDGLIIDTEGFERSLAAQKERSRTASRIKGDGWEEGHVAILREDIRNEFVGYDAFDREATILSILRSGGVIDELAAGEEGELFFDYTPFYGESGGQVGDEGFVRSPSGNGRVLDVERVKTDLFSHMVTVVEGRFKIGDRVSLTIDTEKRKGVSRNHTATHLLQYALRTVLGDHVKQSGSLVEKDRLRFDFTHFRALDEAQISRVEDIVNEKIMECCDVTVDLKDREEAIREGATALFEEKYGERVRVIRICDFSAELCGGTHVKNTGEIGSFAVLSEGSLAYGVRRIEAVTGKGSITYRRKLEGIVRSVSKLVNTEADRLEERIAALTGELGDKEKALGRMKEEAALNQVEAAIRDAAEKDGVKIVTLFVADARADDLRKATDMIRSRLKTCVGLVGTSDGDKGMLVIAVSKDLQGRLNAGVIMKRLTERFSGKGGGGPLIAQGGVPGNKVEAALKALAEVVGEKQ